MHPATTYSIIKTLLSELTGRPVSNIYADQTLAGDLGFTPEGQFSLNVDMNEAFSDAELPLEPPLHGDETAAAVTVRDLWMLANGRVQ